MKKVLFVFSLLIALSFGLLVPATPAHAETASAPHIIIPDNVWLCSSSGDRLFLLPKTYYAEITGMDETFYFVTFNGVAGRVEKTEVTTVGYHTKADGTMRDMKVDDAFSEFPAINLKSRPDLASTNLVAMPTTANFTFVGRFPLDKELWYAVRFDQYFGYIRASRTNIKDVTFDDFVPQEAPVIANPVENPDENGQNNTGGATSATTLKIVLVVGLIVPAVLIVFLIFKPRGDRAARR